MAFIHYVKSTATSITVYLDGLDTSYAGSERREQWYIAPHGSNEYSLVSDLWNETSGQDRFEDVRLDNLEVGAWYDVYCVVSNADGETLATITEIRSDYYILDGVWTLNAAPTINSFGAEVTSYSLREIHLSWNVSDVILGVSTYEIICYGYDTGRSYIYSGVVDSYSQELYISVDSYEDYNINIYVTTEGADEASNGAFVYMRDIAPRNLEVTNRGYRSLSFAWSGADEADEFEICLQGGLRTIPKTCYYPTKSVEFAAVYDFGVTYTVSVQGQVLTEDGVWLYSEEMFNDPVTSLPAPPILAVSQNDGYITVDYSVPKFYSFGQLYYSYADTFNFALRNESGEVIYTASVDTANINHPSGTYTFPIHCEPGTYTIEGWTIKSGLQCITETNENSVFSDSIEITENLRPENWDWHKQNGDEATLAQTLTAHDALTNVDKTKRYTTNFHYKVWNDFVDKVKEFLVYKKVDSITVSIYERNNITQGELLETAKMDNENRKMTPNRFNIVRFMIGSMAVGGSGISGDFVEGQELKGSYILTLAEAIKNIE